MPVTLPNFLSVEAKDYGALSPDLLSHAIEGYKAARLPKQIRQEEQQRELANRLLGHQGTRAEIENRFLPESERARIDYTKAGTGLLGEQTEAAKIQNRLDRLHKERQMLAGIHSTEAITYGHQLDNQIKKETGMLQAYLDMQNKNLMNKGEMQRQEFYPLSQNINALEGLGRIRKGDFEQDVAEQFDIPQRKIEQSTREVNLREKEHDLKLKETYDQALLELEMQKQKNEITKQEYDNELARIKSLYAERVQRGEIAQQGATLRGTEATTAGTQASTIGQEIENQVNQRHLDRKADLANKYTQGLISSNELADEAKKIDNEYQREFKELEKKEKKANISGTKANTKSVMADIEAKNLANKLNGQFGEQERKLAVQQANEGVKQAQIQTGKAWKDMQEQIKYGDQTKAAELQALHDTSQLAQAKIFEAMAEANKHNKAYEGVPEGSVPLSEFQRTAQNSIIKEQEQTAIRIENAEEAVRILDKMEKIVDKYPDFGKDWRIALTVNDKPGVLKNLVNTLAPGQNYKKKAAAEQFLKYSQDLVLKLGPASLGARFTDAKYRGMQAAKPFVHNTPEANKAVIGHMRKELAPLTKYKKDFQKARYKYTLPFDWEKYSDIPLDQLSNNEFNAIEMAQGLE